MHILRSITLLLAAASLAGCATQGGIGGLGKVGAAFGLGGQVVNGYHLVQASPEDFHLGQYAQMPRATSQADLVAMDDMTKKYAAVMKKAAAKGDTETYAVARHLAEKTAGYRLYLTAGTANALASMYASGASNVGLKPGAYVMLPAFNRITQPTNKTAALATMTADISGLFGTVSDMAKTVGRIQDMSAVRPKSLLESMPEGIPYTGTNSAGQTFIVERSNDMFILHNPGKEPIKVDAESLGYAPRLAAPDPMRKRAAPILFNLQAAGLRLYQQANGNGRVYTEAPNVLIGSLAAHHVLLDEQGREAQDRASVQRGASAYRLKSEYRLAVHLWDESTFHTPQRKAFDHACLGSESGKSVVELNQGEYLEVIEMSCRDALLSPIYSKTFYTYGDKGLMQTWDSVLKDRKTQDAINKALGTIGMADALASLTPVYGNLDSGARCTSGQSLTETALRAFNPNLAATKLSSFVGMTDDSSLFGKAMDCLGALPVAGSIAGMTGKVARLGGVNANRLAQLEKTLGLFDSNWVSGRRWAETAETVGQFKNPNAVMMAKVFYEGAQANSTFGQMKDSFNSMN